MTPTPPDAVYPLDDFCWAIDLKPGAGLRDADTLTGAANTHQVAGVASRALAWWADATLQLAAVAVLASAVPVSGAAAAAVALPMAPVGRPVWAGLAVASYFLLHVGYHLAWELLGRGGSFGKSLFGLRVVGRDGDPRPAPWRMVARNLARPLDWLPAWGMAGGMLAWAAPARGRLGDRLAGTVVVRRRPLRAQLALAACTPASAYSTSDDGYLLEAIAARRRHGLDPEASAILSARLAGHLHRAHPVADDPELHRLIGDGEHEAYLDRRLRTRA